tara:strand:- start:6600 stop:6953 length:354 start_codon:yes stop_codon:yes gene_type:complete
MNPANFSALAGMTAPAGVQAAAPNFQIPQQATQQQQMQQQQFAVQQQMIAHQAAQQKPVKKPALSASGKRCHQFQQILNGKDTFGLIKAALKLELSENEYNIHWNHVGMSMQMGKVF